MTASELAFLGLGLLLGAASGAALLIVLGSRLPRREIRVTVTPGAVPSRSETLSQDAFITSPGEPARGGPGDRRWNARDEPESGPPARPMAPAMAVAIPTQPVAAVADGRPRDRTIVPTGPGRPAPDSPGRTPPRPVPPPPVPRRPRITTTVPIGSATAIAIEEDAERELEQAAHRRAWGSALERMFRGEHRAMAEALDRVAGPDSPQRREWEHLLGGFVEAMGEMAVRESVIDFPMGTAFWDSFTVEQCRRIVAALASMGFTYDGRGGWTDSRAPAYRDLTQALADVGIDPRRIRAWPNSSDIAGLFVGARPAPEELLAAAGPGYHVDDVRELVGDRATELSDLWLAWEAVRPILLDEHLTAT